MKKVGRKIRIALLGIGQVMARPQYLASTIIIALIFIFVFNIFASGNNFWQLLIHLPWTDKFSVIGEIYVDFIRNILSLEKFMILVLSILQGILISLIVFSARHSTKNVDDKSVLGGGLTALFGLLAVGCPTCGTSILVGVFAMIFGVTSYGWAQVIDDNMTILSIVLMFVALIIILFALRRQGFICHMLINAKQARAKD